MADDRTQIATISLEGTDRVARELERLTRQLPHEAATALYEEAELVMGIAKERTPVDTGALRRSGYVRRPEVVGDTLQVALSFGGPTVSYALYVHENLKARHRVGQAKFLESAVAEAHPAIWSRIADRLKAKLGWA